MTDKKLTDEEVVKALECCKDCSINLNFEIVQKIEDKNKEILELIDIINSLKAEIERLKECPRCVYEYDGETMEYCVRRKSDDKLFQFYAGTGKIMGFENKRGIHSFWD